jgi:hypothetical protein
MILNSRRESNNEIHTYLLPFPTWHRKWLKQSSFHVHSFNSTTSITPSNICNYLFPHLGPLIVCFRSWYILLLPGWMDNLEKCASDIIWFLTSRSLGTTNLSLNYTTPSSSTLKCLVSYSFILRLMWNIPVSVFWSSIILLLRVQLIVIWCRTAGCRRWDRWKSLSTRNGNETYGLKHRQPHLPCQDDSALGDYNL